MTDKPKTEELMLEARNFLNSVRKDVGKDIRSGRNVIFVNFEELSSFSPILSELLISSPEEILQVLEVALSESGLIQNPRVRLKVLPDGFDEKIRNLRAKHLNRLIQVEGIVRQASEVRPQVVSAKFECPACGTIISVLQIESKFREPTRCSCGRKGQFRLISKEMVDVQRLVIEESPESLIGGEQPRRVNIFLKEDLVEPKMEEKTTPGSRVKIIGTLKEIAKHSQTGTQLVRFDIAVEANNIIPLEESYEELNITEEDERQIQELAADPHVFEKFIGSIAPSIYGYEEIKQSIVFQLFGGVKKLRSDGTTHTRGDMHILLVGDPGVAKSIGRNEKILYVSANQFGYDTIENISKKFKRFPESLKVLTIDMKNHQPRWENVFEIIKHLPEKDLIKVSTEHGKSITATKDHSFITISKNGEIVPIKGEELTEESYLPIPVNHHRQELNFISTSNFNTKRTNSKILPDKIKLDKDFGFFMGIFLAEGYIKNKKAIEISNQNKEIQKKVMNFSRKLKLNYTLNKQTVSIFSKNLSDLLMNYCYSPEDLKCIKRGNKGNFSRIKKIPDFAYFSPKEFIYGMISGIFSGDGRLTKDKKMLKGFELTTISKKLAEGVSDLLFSIGILNIIKKREYTYKNKKTLCYYLSVPTFMIKKFLENMEMIGRDVKLNKNEPIYSYKNLIPCGDLVYEVVKKLGYNRRIGGNRTLAAEMRTVKKRKVIGKIRLLKLIKEFESRLNEETEELKLLKRIANSEIIWSRVTKIEILKKKNEEVYDLFIPSTNTFVSNGIGVHNSVMLKFIAGIAPKGRYVVGKSASGAGLTATVVRDEFLRGWSLEAGAMVLANKGVVCIDELEKMDPQDRSAMHEALEQQCMLPDFKLMLSNGKYVKIGRYIDNLVENHKSKVIKGKDCEMLEVNDTEILSTDFSNTFPVKASRVSRHLAPESFIKIELSNGREITVTPEHPCWIVKNGKIITVPAEKLTNKDYFSVPSSIEIKEKEYKKENDILCKILGYHISDGCYELNRGKKTGIQFWNNDIDLIEDYKQAVDKFFGINTIITKRRHQFAVRAISKKVRDYMANLDPTLLEKGIIKKIPDEIMNLHKENIKYLLRALFDGDGTVVLEKRNGCRVSLSTENLEITEQVSDLLLRFGITSSIFKDKNTWKIDISGQENLLKYLTNISFLSKHKKQRLKDYCSINKTYRTIKDIIPNCTNKINEIFKKLKISAKKEIGHSIDLGVEKQRLFLQKLILIAERYAIEKDNKELLKEIEKIKKLAFGFSRWIKIKRISKIKNDNIRWVYDVTVEPHHTFISNGMILHNTVTITKANVQACYSEDTEVLTETGWKNYNEVKNEKIAQYNPSDKTMRFLPHKGLYVYDYNGKMYHFKNESNDIFVTPNHKMLAREFSQKNLKAVEAQNLNYNYIKFTNSGDFIGEEQKYFTLPAIKHIQKRIHKKYVHQHFEKIIPMDLWLEFLGYYVTEGGIETAPTIGIVQKKGEKAEKIRKCLKKLTETLSCSLSEIDCSKYMRYKLTQTQLYEYLKNLGEKCYFKKSCLNFSLLSKRQLKILFDAMMLGDGSSDNKSFSVTSKKLCDEFQIIAHLIGKSAPQHIHYKENYRKNRKTMFRISLSDKTEPSIRKKDIKIKDYNGKVFCFSTETGFFVTRRNGKIAIQGNTLRAETSVLAAANPKFGRFDPYQTVASQIDIPPTLINRFDVVFILKDIPDRTKDEAIAHHVLEGHRNVGEKSAIESGLLRKYIAYAKQKIVPQLTDASVEEIKKFYVDLRNDNQVSGDSPIKPLPISARQLEALIRMSEAGAKIRLSQKVTREDAKRAINLMKFYLMQVGYDYETKTFDIDRIATGVSTSQRGKIMLVKDTIARLESRLGKLIPIEEIKKELEGKIDEKEIDDSLDKLTISGDIFHPRKGCVQRM